MAKKKVSATAKAALKKRLGEENLVQKTKKNVKKKKKASKK